MQAIRSHLAPAIPAERFLSRRLAPSTPHPKDFTLQTTSNMAPGHSVSVEVVSEPEEVGGWAVLEVNAEGFGEDELIMHWGVGKLRVDEWAVGNDCVR